MSALLTARRLPTESANTNLAERIRQQLAADSRAVWRLEVNVDGGVVTLRGTATSFYQKQLWLHGTKRVIGDEAIINDEITVAPTVDDSDFAWRD
jgi:hypothetical protein